MGTELLIRLEQMAGELHSAGYSLSAAYVQMAADAIQENMVEAEPPEDASEDWVTSNQ